MVCSSHDNPQALDPAKVVMKHRINNLIITMIKSGWKFLDILKPNLMQKTMLSPEPWDHCRPSSPQQLHCRPRPPPRTRPPPGQSPVWWPPCGRCWSAPAWPGARNPPLARWSANTTIEWIVVLWTINRRSCTITEKAPTRAFSWLKADTTAFTFKTLNWRWPYTLQ